MQSRHSSPVDVVPRNRFPQIPTLRCDSGSAVRSSRTVCNARTNSSEGAGFTAVAGLEDLVLSLSPQVSTSSGMTGFFVETITLTALLVKRPMSHATESSRSP